MAESRPQSYDHVLSYYVAEDELPAEDDLPDADEPAAEEVRQDEVCGETHSEIEVAAMPEAPDYPAADAHALGEELAAARKLADDAKNSEDRTRHALYEAIGKAYDFSLAAAEAPEDFETLIADAGLAMQERAPMTPVVKLVFGADYDKTRITEYAAALAHAHRHRLERGALARFIESHEGGLKGVVQAERRLRREETGQPAETAHERIARQLRDLAPIEFEAIPASGAEFALVMIRRDETGDVVLLGEVPEDAALVERAARKLLG